MPLTKAFDVFLIEPVPVSCDYKGKGYTSGNVVPAGDGCNTCSCKPDGTMNCTNFPCLRGKHQDDISVWESMFEIYFRRNWTIN